MGKDCDTKRFVHADGSINWQDVQERRRKKRQGKHNSKKLPEQEDTVNRAHASTRATASRGPTHVALLEDQSPGPGPTD